MIAAWMANVPFGVYLVALLVFGISYVGSWPKWRTAGEWLLGIGWVAQTALIISRWMAAGRPPMTNQYESLLILAWGMMAFYFILRNQLKISGFGFWASAGTLTMMATASLFDSEIMPLVPALQSNWLLYHVIVIMLGYSAFALAAVLAGVYVVCFSKTDVRDPKAASLDATTMRAAGLGFLLLGVGIMLGSVWANEAWGAYWSWDPKETWSLITWLLYAVAIHLRRTRGWLGTKFAWMMIGGFIAVLFTYFGVNFLLAGLHSYA